MLKNKNLLIVDDEYIVRQWISMVIRNTAQEYNIIGEAASGEEAIELCKINKVDIIITDIKMSPIDGIQLLKEIKLAFPLIKFIILSNYDDFKYAKEALKIGASDYLLKAEICDRDIISCLNKVRSEIDIEEDEKLRQSEILNKVNMNINIVKQSFFKSILDGFEKDDDKIREKLKYLNVNLDKRNIFVVVLDIDDYHSISSTEKPSVDYKVMGLIERILCIFFNSGVLTIYENKYVILINVMQNSLKTIREQLYLFISRIISEVSSLFNLSISAGISLSSNDYLLIHEQYEMAITALNEKFFDGKGSIIFFSDFGMKDRDNSMKVVNTKLCSVYKCLDAWNLPETEVLIDSIFGETELLSNLKPDDIRYLSARIIQLFIEKAQKTHIDIKNEGLNLNVFKESEKHDFLYSITNWVKFTVKDIIVLINNNVSTSDIVNKAIDYLNRNYNNNVSLVDVANYVHLSPNYLSKLFKEKTGENFSNYINKVRIEKSKQLLRNTDIKIHNISINVGYPNESYFTRVFKKFEGLSPFDYRSIIRTNKSSNLRESK